MHPAVTSQYVAQPENDILKTTLALDPLVQESLSTMESERRLPLRVVDALRELGAFRLAATSAIYRSHPLDRPMRDILTACRHGVVHPKMYRPAGRLLLGLESGDPLF